MKKKKTLLAQMIAVVMAATLTACVTYTGEGR